ncbi:MAG: DUF1330 domain-containing protein [Dongiaceae bacterium]
MAVLASVWSTATSAQTAKGYWITNNDVTDVQGHAAYIAANREHIQNCGGKYLILGGRQEIVEGQARSRHVVIEFKDYATALGCNNSAEYAKVKMLRVGKSEGDTVVVEGIPPRP